jgi:hypothetical protein
MLKPFDLAQMKKKLGKFIDFDGLEKRFGVTAVQKGFIAPHHLFEALNVQVMENVEKGKHRLLGSILLDQGLITTTQVDDVLRSLPKRCAEPPKTA